jgi:esterase
MSAELEPRSGTETVNGGRLHYLDWGNEEAQPLLLLHGFTGHAQNWDAFARSMARHFHVVAFDQRGHGESAWTDDYSGEAMIADVDAFVRQVGLRRFVLLGVSMGGRNAFNYAGMHPDEVERLIVVDIGPEMDPAGAARIISTVTTMKDVFDNREEAFEQARAYNPRPPAERQREWIYSGLMQTADGKWIPKYDKALRTGPPPFRIAPERSWANWRAVRCPTLLVRGELSDVLSADVAERMAREHPSCELVTIAGSGHPVPLDRPEEFEAAVRQWLKV